MAGEGHIMNIQKLMHVADRAKTIGEGDYTLPNAVFALLLAEYFAQRQTEDGAAEQKETLSLMLETQDEKGVSPSEAHYDLFVLSLKGGENERTASLCIPAPLVEPRAIIAAMKSATCDYRGEHNRECEDGEAGELDELWSELFEEVTPEVLATVATTYLVPQCFVQAWTPEPEEVIA